MLSERDPETDDSKGGAEFAVRPKKRARRAARLVKLGGLAVVVAGIIVVAGFLRFAEEVVEMKVPDPGTKVDAIVVLTGGHQRIDQAVELLKQGVAQRLFISGVNPTTTSNEIRRLTNSSKALFSCCVDIGHDAIDTIGNAYETARWISEKGYSRVFLVTNNYHMPRSLMELRRVDPRTDFIPYPVINNDLKAHNWLRQPEVVRRLVTEYVKYSVASLRDMIGSEPDKGLRTDRAHEDARLVSNESR
jgi:uncharacterized SAM-binding protein YcdF (DUF218 family)